MAQNHSLKAFQTENFSLSGHLDVYSRICSRVKFQHKFEICGVESMFQSRESDFGLPIQNTVEHTLEYTSKWLLVITKHWH